MELSRSESPEAPAHQTRPSTAELIETRRPHPAQLRVPAAPAPLQVRGKFLFAGEDKLIVKGVTYGPFRPAPDGCEYHDPATVGRDFRAMARMGFNAVRVYTVPPGWLLDTALAYGLRVMVGLPWEQHVTFLDDRSVTRRVMDSVRTGVRACAGHPALLCFAIGNEIPAPIVRWLGPAAVQAFLERLYRAAKAEDPDTLVTYVNYPTTEYLRLPFLDFLTFNVYLETEQQTSDYIARLQNLAGEQPLLMAEVGLDSMRNGEAKQAESIAWQVRSTLQGGCAGTFVFAWTDEWFRGGHEIEDWAFGLVRRDRQPKPALAAAAAAFGDPMLPQGRIWPRISVVVCSYNGERTIRETFDALHAIDYPDFEVIVVDDGSTDRTAEIAREYPFRLISGPNGGLSRARNIGMRAATGEIVAYIDDDAWPDPHWLHYLAIAFLTRDHVGIGGPNLAPPDDGEVADCVANSPGGPSHVLYTDLLAEHLPGCNMAFRRDAIMAIDGFDARFRIAGDDVDLCWRLMANGGTLGFHSGAVVWHHRRGRVKHYLKQQRNYGRAEAMLEQKWPEKYNRLGHLRWAGTLYGKGHTRVVELRAPRIHHGVWGSRLFQAMYTRDFESAWYITLMPEWYMVTLALAGLTALGFSWPVLFALTPVLVFAVVVPLVQVAASARRARFTSPSVRTAAGALRLYGLTAGLHILQPLARLLGRLGYRLTPWRPHGLRGNLLPRAHRFDHWSEVWRSQIDWLTSLERRLQGHRVLVRRGGEQDRWDLQAACGLFGGARLLSTVEEHGSGKQLVRVRAWPRLSRLSLVTIPLLAAAGALAARDGAWVAAAVLGTLAVLSGVRCWRECSGALSTIGAVVEGQLGEDGA